MQNMLKRVSMMGTLAEMRKECEIIARDLTIRYEYQLRELRTLAQENAAIAAPTPSAGATNAKLLMQRVKASLQRTKQKVEHTVLNKEAISPSEVLAEYVVAKVWDLMQEPVLVAAVPANPVKPTSAAATTPTATTVQDLHETALPMLSVATVMPVRPNVLQALILGASRCAFTTKTGSQWLIGEIFVRCGVQTPSGNFYDGPNKVMNPTLYGYCIGSDAEQVQRSLVTCSVVCKNPQLAKVGSAAQSKFVNANAQQHAATADKVELLKKQQEIERQRAESKQKDLEQQLEEQRLALEKQRLEMEQLKQMMMAQMAGQAPAPVKVASPKVPAKKGVAKKALPPPPPTKK